MVGFTLWATAEDPFARCFPPFALHWQKRHMITTEAHRMVHIAVQIIVSGGLDRLPHLFGRNSDDSHDITRRATRPIANDDEDEECPHKWTWHWGNTDGDESYRHVRMGVGSRHKDKHHNGRSQEVNILHAWA